MGGGAFSSSAPPPGAIAATLCTMWLPVSQRVAHAWGACRRRAWERIVGVVDLFAR